jgi:CDP-diacylglycerol---serine O-phosphatidyltransferase
MNIKKHIPNFLTCCNLICGCLALSEAFHGKLQNASMLIFIACLFDFFDGFAARFLKVMSPIGKELDSLADCITFGVVPSIIIFQLINHSIIIQEVTSPFIPLYLFTLTYSAPLAYVAFTIAVFSALRLAKFNIDIRQSDSFIGVPTPANAILIAAIPLILPVDHLQNNLFNIKSYLWYQMIACSPYFLIGLTLIMSYLLIAEIPLFALKFKSFKWAENNIRYSFLISSLLLFIFLIWTAIPLIIFLYVILSLIENKILKAKAH